MPGNVEDAGAQAVWHLGCSLLLFHWTVYYDDFFSVTEKESAKHCEMCLSGFFALMGWGISADKELAFSHTARILAVNICILSECVFQVANTSERKDELIDTINKLLHAGKFGKKDLTSLRGRLRFAEGQLFGRKCYKHMKVISDRASLDKPGHLDSELKQALVYMRDRVVEGEPRVIKSSSTSALHWKLLSIRGTTGQGRQVSRTDVLAVAGEANV